MLIFNAIKRWRGNIQCRMINEVLLDKGKQNDPKMKVERKEGEPTPLSKGLLGQRY